MKSRMYQPPLIAPVVPGIVAVAEWKYIVFPTRVAVADVFEVDGEVM